MIDFQKVKEERQQYMDHSFLELYESFFDYIEKEANIREKVRAKQIFLHKTNLPKESLQEKTIAPHFEHWFAFDYVTVIGSRLFDIFIREKKGLLSKSMLDISGFMMLMYLEPVRIVHGDKRLITYKKLAGPPDLTFEGESFLFSQTMIEGELAFVRTINVGYREKFIGPPIVIEKPKEGEVMNRLNEVMKQDLPAIRKYLKEHGIDYLRYQKREG